MIPPPVWPGEALEAQRKKAIELFRDQRLDEPLSVYSDEFEYCRRAFEDLMESLIDLGDMSIINEQILVETLSDKTMQDAFRYLAGPPISKDDLKTLANVGPGEFCPESQLGTRKADVIVRLWDTRVLAIECKESNSSTNSIKRLNNDAVVKATNWRSEFGTQQIIPAAVLAGVFELRNLVSAQSEKLTLWWGCDLQRMLTWIEQTRP